jgi:hypothetical protein
MNLLQNATDAIEGPGTITITTSQNPEWVTIVIRDTGRGLKEDDLAVLGLNQLQIVHENGLPVTVAAAFPPPASVLGIEAYHNSVVETVNEAVVVDAVRELRFEADGCPDEL